MRNTIKRLFVEEEGISSVEYAILLAFVAAALVAVVGGLSGQVTAAFNAACTQLSGAPCA